MLRVSAAQAEQWSALAKADHRTLSDWIRVRCLEAVEREQTKAVAADQSDREQRYVDTFLAEVDDEVLQ